MISPYVCAVMIGCLLLLTLQQSTTAYSEIEAPACAEQVQEQQLGSGVRIVVDRPTGMDAAKPTLVVFYALPNGNTTA